MMQEIKTALSPDAVLAAAKAFFARRAPIYAPFVASLRSRPGAIHLGRLDSQGITVRVEMPELWDVVRIVAPPTESVLEVKLAALGAMNPKADPGHYVMKLRGFEV